MMAIGHGEKPFSCALSKKFALKIIRLLKIIFITPGHSDYYLRDEGVYTGNIQIIIAIPSAPM